MRNNRSGSAMTTLAIVAFDGVTDVDVFLHWDVLNRPMTMFGRAWCD